MNREEFIKKLNALKDDCKKENWEDVVLIDCLIDLASAFCAIADDQYKKSQLIYKTYWQNMFEGTAYKKNDKTEGFKNQLSRPIAFQIPENLSANSLLLLIAKTATDCLEELRFARQMTEDINIPDLLEKLPELSRKEEKKIKEKIDDPDIPF